MPLDKEALQKAIDAGREASYSTDHNSDLGARRKEVIEAYLGYNQNPAPEGRSQIVDRTIYQTIHTILPSLVRIFASSSETVCKFLPVGPEDEAAAEQTTHVINHVVTEQNQWEQLFSDWCHEGLISPNSYALAYWDKSENVTRERYEGQSEDQLAALLADKSLTVLEHSEYPDKQTNADNAAAYQQALMQYQQALPQWQQAALMAQQQGQQPPPQPQPPQPPRPVTLHDVVVEKRETEGKVCIKVLPPEHCFVSIDTPDWTLKECPYFEWVQEVTVGSLRAQGLDVPDDISDDEDYGDTDEDYARDRFAETDIETGEGALRKVWARSIWVDADIEGDGLIRKYYVIAVGKTILYAEPVSRIPVASLVSQSLPHRHPGYSVAESILDIQHTKTAIKRGGLDNLYLANSGRTAVSDKVVMSDVLDSRPGGVIRFTDGALPGEGHIMPIQHPFAFDSIVGSLEYFDQEGQNRTGASRYFAGTDAGAINKTAAGTAMLQNSAAHRVEHIARMIAPAVEYLFSVVHELISKHQNKQLSLRLNGEWVAVDPQAWRTKRDVRISVGVGAGNKESMLLQLGNMYAAQLQLLPMGVARPEHIHATVTEMAKLAGFSHPEKFWAKVPEIQNMPQPPDPEQTKAQAQMQMEQFKAQQEAAKFQEQQQAERQKFQAQAMLEQQKLQMQAELDKHREELDARQKTLEAEQKAALELQKAQLEREKEEARLAFERYKVELDAAVKLQIAGMSQQQPDTRIDEVIAAVQQLAQQINSPAEIVRGPDGKAIGVKRGDVVRTITRGPDGRAIGIQ